MPIPPETDPPEAAQLAQAVRIATALIELALQDSLAPIATLARALARIAAAAPPPALAAELAACIESLQFHDRMTQQLTAVRALLAGAVGDPARAHEPRDWPALRARLHTHVTTDSQRMLFNLPRPAGEEPGPARAHAADDGVELF